MRTQRIELDGDAGHVAIEREPGSTTIRIDSIVRDPKPGVQAWKVWKLPAGINEGELFGVAACIQERTDGHPGTNSMIQDYYRELQRFAD